MILYMAGKGLYETKRALLEKLDDMPLALPRFCHVRQITSYVGQAPGVKFVLLPASPLATSSADNLLKITAADAYGPQFGDFLCGIVMYDGARK